MPAQITVRADDELIARVKGAARRADRSMNDYVVWVLDAATNPNLAGDETAAVRERLAAASLLDAPGRTTAVRPSRQRIAEARARAGRGTPLAQLVSDSR